MTLSGENLKPGSRVLVSGEGVAATVAKSSDEKSLTLNVTAESDAASGVRELRLLGPNGASNAARSRWARSRISARRAEQQAGEAQALKELPATVYGRIDPLGDTDVFRFHARAGETWVFELGSDELRLQPGWLLALRDASGRELATVVKTQIAGPRLVHTFEAGGDYTISVRDVTLSGRAGG